MWPLLAETICFMKIHQVPQQLWPEKQKTKIEKFAQVKISEYLRYLKSYIEITHRIFKSDLLPTKYTNLCQETPIDSEGMKLLFRLTSSIIILDSKSIFLIFQAIFSGLASLFQHSILKKEESAIYINLIYNDKPTTTKVMTPGTITQKNYLTILRDNGVFLKFGAIFSQLASLFLHIILKEQESVI